MPVSDFMNFDTHQEPNTNIINTGSSTASAPNPQGFKILATLMILSQAMGGCKASVLVVYEPMTVDRGLIAWRVFTVLVLF